MKIAVFISLVFFRIVASYISLFLLAWELDEFIRAYGHGRVDVVFYVLFCLFWTSGIFPTAKLMLRKKVSRRALMLLLVIGFLFHVCRFLLPVRYVQLVFGDDWRTLDLYSGSYWIIALYGFAPLLVCLFEYLWMRRSTVTKPVELDQ